jgi:hypothetical protein
MSDQADAIKVLGMEVSTTDILMPSLERKRDLASHLHRGGVMSQASSLCVVIPMKDPDEAKSRLGDTLPGKARAALTRTLFRQTLRVLKTVDPSLHVVVVTNRMPSARSAIPSVPICLMIRAPALNDAVTAGRPMPPITALPAVCILPGDLADPSPCRSGGAVCPAPAIRIGDHCPGP